MNLMKLKNIKLYASDSDSYNYYYHPFLKYGELDAQQESKTRNKSSYKSQYFKRITLYSSRYSSKTSNIADLFQAVIREYNVAYDLAVLGIEAHYYTLYLLANTIEIIKSYLEELRKTFGVAKDSSRQIKSPGGKLENDEEELEYDDQEKTQSPEKDKDKKQRKENLEEAAKPSKSETKKESTRKKEDDDEDLIIPDLDDKDELVEPEILREAKQKSKRRKAKSRNISLYSRAYSGEETRAYLHEYGKIEDEVKEIILKHIEDALKKGRSNKKKSLQEVIQKAVTFYNQIQVPEQVVDFFSQIKDNIQEDNNLEEKAARYVIDFIRDCLTTNSKLYSSMGFVLNRATLFKSEFKNISTPKSQEEIPRFVLKADCLDRWHKSTIHEGTVKRVLEYKTMIGEAPDTKQRERIRQINFAHYNILVALYKNFSIIGGTVFDTICSAIKDYVRKKTDGQKTYSCPSARESVKDFREKADRGKYVDDESFGILGDLALFLKKKLDRLGIETPGIISMPGKLLEKGVTCLALRKGYEALLKKADQRGDKALKEDIIKKIRKDIKFRNQAGLETKCLEKMLKKYNVSSYW